MPNVSPNISIEDAARKLASENVKFVPSLLRIYLFPSPKEIRLIEIDPNTLPIKRVQPFYFRSDPKGGYPYPIAVALVTPEDEANRIPLPKSWGTWHDAQIIWEKQDSASG